MRGGREIWIDIAKSIGIFLVVLAHALPRDNYFWRLINLFHMPLFFIISGYLYQNKGSIIQFVKHKIITLWIPYITCSGITVLVTILLHLLRLMQYQYGFSIKYIVKIIFMLDMGPLLGASWFIQVLFYAAIAYNIVERFVDTIINKNEQQKTLILNTLSVLFLVIGLNTSLIFRGSVILNSIAYFNVGVIFRKNRELIFKFGRKLLLPIFIVVPLIAKNNCASYVTNTYSNKLLFLMTSILGSFGILLLSHELETEKSKLVAQTQFIGRNTMAILFWQFVSFKLVILLQIAYYQLPVSCISTFPVMYEYDGVVWIFLYVIAGIYVSIMLNYPIKILDKTVLQFIKKK